MLQLLQYFVGTSIAALLEVAEMTIVQSVVEGPTVSGSSLALGGGNGCKFRGRIYDTLDLVGGGMALNDLLLGR